MLLVFPSDHTSSPAESRPAPPRAAPPRVIARPTEPLQAVSPRPSAVAQRSAVDPQPSAVDRRAPARLQALPSWLLSQASGIAASLVDDALSADGIRRQDYRVLVALDEAGAASQADLGRSVWLDRSDLHGVVTALERRGLVARERDPDDRRRNVVTLTDTGRKTLAELNDRIDAAQALLLEPLTAQDRTALVRLLGAVIERSGA